MHTVLFTGNTGAGSSLAAAATAAAAAEAGQRTLLVSVGPSHSLGALLGVAPGTAPHPLSERLAVWVLDTPTGLSAVMEQVRGQLPGPLARLAGDELPLVAGLEFFVLAEGMRRHASNYDIAVVDAGPHDGLLHVLALPDNFRWLIRLLFGLDRGAGSSPASLARAVLPVSLIPSDWTDQVQNARVLFERARDEALASANTTVRYVLRPDPPALAEARLAMPALHLHGLAVDALLVGPLLPEPDTLPDPLHAAAAQQHAVTAEAAELWAACPLVRLPLAASTSDLGELAQIGQALYAPAAATVRYPTDPPIMFQTGSERAVSIALPGLPRGALHLTLSGDELIVRVGPYRRHLLLPDELRGQSNIRASREAGRLRVRLAATP